jgi:hypothetical protein
MVRRSSPFEGNTAALSVNKSITAMPLASSVLLGEYLHVFFGIGIAYVEPN